MAWRGGWVFPDTNAHGRGENPQHLYNVAFFGRGALGPTAEPGVVVHIDLFEPYWSRNRWTTMTDPRAPALRAEALESLLVESGLITRTRSTRSSSVTTSEIGPLNGASWWRAPGSTRRSNARCSPTAPRRSRLRVRRRPERETRRPREHRGSTTSSSVRCARAIRGRCSGCRRAGTKSGLPLAHRARAAARAREIGLTLAADVEIRVWDSSAEVRYMVLPQRPAGTDGVDEEPSSARRVTRDAMIGVELLR